MHICASSFNKCSYPSRAISDISKLVTINILVSSSSAFIDMPRSTLSYKNSWSQGRPSSSPVQSIVTCECHNTTWSRLMKLHMWVCLNDFDIFVKTCFTITFICPFWIPLNGFLLSSAFIDMPRSTLSYKNSWSQGRPSSSPVQSIVTCECHNHVVSV
jgi:hypothetical protein